MCQDQNNTFNLGEIKVWNLPLLEQILLTVYGVNFAQFDVRQIKFIRFWHTYIGQLLKIMVLIFLALKVSKIIKDEYESCFFREKVNLSLVYFQHKNG